MNTKKKDHLILRMATLAILLAAALGWLRYEQRHDRTHQADEWFLDFLVANAREAFSSNPPEESPEVVLVQFRGEEQAEYSSWPPAPLDYIMVLKRLVEHDPKVLVVVEPLRWDEAATEFVTQLRNAFVPFPSVVVGFHLDAQKGEMAKEQADFASKEMPVLPAAEGSRKGVPVFTRVIRLSDWSLRIISQGGFSAIEGLSLPKDAVPFIADDGSRLVPSLAAQAVILYHRMPYAAQRLRFGTGARLSLGGEFMIPLADDGTLSLTTNPQVPTVNALELMTPDLGDTTSREVQELLGKGKVLVLDSSNGSGRHAQAIACALAMPQVKRAPGWAEWAFAGLAGLICLWQLRFLRIKALLFGGAAIIGGLAVCLVVFQSSLLWWSPLPALLMLVVSTLLCFIWPARNRPVAILSPMEPVNVAR